MTLILTQLGGLNGLINRDAENHASTRARQLIPKGELQIATIIAMLLMQLAVHGRPSSMALHFVYCVQITLTPI